MIKKILTLTVCLILQPIVYANPTLGKDLLILTQNPEYSLELTYQFDHYPDQPPPQTLHMAIGQKFAQIVTPSSPSSMVDFSSVIAKDTSDRVIATATYGEGDGNGCGVGLYGNDTHPVIRFQVIPELGQIICFKGLIDSRGVSAEFGGQGD